MMVAIIILSIGLIGSVFFNILLYLSKNSYISKIKEIQKSNKELRLNKEELENLVGQQENKIKSYEKILRTSEHQKKEIELLKKENDDLKEQIVVIEDAIKNVDDNKAQITILEKENKQLILRVAELEKNISVLSVSNDRERQLDETIEKQKLKISSLAGQIDQKEEEKKNANQRCEDATRKLTEIQLEVEQLKDQNAVYKTQLISMQKQNDDFSANINSLLTSCNNYKIQIIQKEERISELEKTIKKLNDYIERRCKPEIPEGIPDDPDEQNFPTDSHVIQFKDGEFTDTLQRISDVSEITEYLQKSSHEKAQKYLKQVKAYAEEIGELKETIESLDEDEDEISAECISRFSKVFRAYMAESIIEPVFKAKKEERFYSDFFKVIIKYISVCGIYSKNVTVGSKYENINYMEVITEDTTDLAKHKIISSILRLPFYAKYTSETGKIKEKLLSKGSCIVFKAK